MTGRARQLDKADYEQAYKKAVKSFERDHKSSSSLPGKKEPAPQSSHALPPADPRSRERTASQPPLVPHSGPSQLPASPHHKHSDVTPKPKHSSTQPAAPRSTNAQPTHKSTADAWVNIYTTDSDLDSKTIIDTHSLAPKSAPMVVNLRYPGSSAVVSSYQNAHPPGTSRSIAATKKALPDVPSPKITLNEYYSGKRKARNDNSKSSVAATSDKTHSNVSNPPHTDGVTTDSVPRPRLVGPSTSAITIPVSRSNKTTQHESRDPRPSYTRARTTEHVNKSTESRDSNTAHKGAGDSKTSREQKSASSQSRAAIPVQWTSDTIKSTPKPEQKTDVPSDRSHTSNLKSTSNHGKQLVPQTHPSREAVVPSDKNGFVTIARPARKHSPPPTRDYRRHRVNRRASIDDDTVRGRNWDTLHDRERERHDRDNTRHNHRSRAQSADRHRHNLWMRDSFDPSKLPPGDLPLVTAILPPLRPTELADRSMHTEKSKSNATAATQTRLVAKTNIVMPTPKPPRQSGLPLPDSAPSTTTENTHGTPNPIFTVRSRLQENFDAATLPPDAWSINTPRSASAPPDHLGVLNTASSGRKLRKRPPLRISMDQAAMSRSIPMSPQLLSPTSVTSTEGGGHHGTLPRRFLPRWLGG